MKTLNVLLIPVGSAGDVHPFVGLGVALKQRGHRVTVLSNDYFESLIRRAGLEYVSQGRQDEFESMLDDPRLWSPRDGFQFVMQYGAFPLMRRTYEAIQKLHEPGRTVIAASCLAFGARLAQEKMKIPLASIHLQPSIFQSAYDPPEFPMLRMRPWWPVPLRKAYWFLLNRMLDRWAGSGLNDYRRELGLPPVRDIVRTWWHSPQMVIGFFPGWFAPPAPDWPPQTHLTGFPLFDAGSVEALDPELDAFLAAGPAPVVFTAGSAMRQGAAFFRESVEACRRLNARGVLITKFPEQLPNPLPPGIRHFSYVPFSRILTRAAAFVHHGGIGTTSQALAGGVPQLVTPFAHDQPDNAARVVRLGAGLRIRAEDYHADRVAGLLSRLLKEPAFRTTAESICRRFEGQDPISETCRLIESISISF